MLTGYVFAVFVKPLARARWVLALYPVVISIRGVVNGVFCARITTGLHMGTVLPRLRGNTERFKLLYLSALTLTLIGGALASTLLAATGTLLWGLNPLGLAGLFEVSIATMAISFFAISPVTLLIAAKAWNRGWNPDLVTYPITSSLADFAATGSYALVLAILDLGELGLRALQLLDLCFVALVAWVFYSNWEEDDYRKTLREAMLALIACTAIVNVAGHALGELSTLGVGAEVFAVYPAVLTTVGDVGSVLGSVSTTKLATGEAPSLPYLLVKNSVELSSTWLASLAMFASYAVLGCVVVGRLERALETLKLLLATNVVAVAASALISQAVAALSFRRGMDPDNLVIPITTTLSDTLTTLAILAAVWLTGA